jgi:hypothetical protein
MLKNWYINTKHNMTPFRLIVLGILFIMWTAFSFGISTIMTDAKFSAWWQIVIALCFLWLTYVAIGHLIQEAS